MRPLSIAVLLILVPLAACGPSHRSAQPSASPSTALPAPSASAPTSSASGPAPASNSPPLRPPTTRPAPPPPAYPGALAGQDVTRIPTSQKIAALTFDAGANADGLASILATLTREGVAATFFLTGDFAKRFPAESKSVAVYRLGNHTMTHPHLPALPASQARAEVTEAQAQILTTTGVDPRPFFRFPYGDRDGASIALVNSLGYVAVRWTVDSLGWQGTAKHTAASVAQRVVDAAQPGEIVLMHVGSNPDDHSTLDADALPAIIAGLRGKGYDFVSLSALLT